MKTLNKKFVRGIILLIIGFPMLYLGVLSINPDSYGAIDPTTTSGLSTIVGGILITLGGGFFLYDLQMFVFKKIGVIK